jgi:hypothetical protein
MNQRTFRDIVVGTACIIIVVLTLFLFLHLDFNSISNKKIALNVEYAGVQNCISYYLVRVFISVPYSTSYVTLYNCEAKVDYLNIFDFWNSAFEYLGVRNYTTSEEEVIIQIQSTFECSRYLERDGLFHEYNESNIRVEAYGFTRP